MSAVLASLWADAYIARHATGPKMETAHELAARLVREARTVALDRAISDLANGCEARQCDIDLFNGDPHMNLRYLDARDEALARHGDTLTWQPEPDPEPDEGAE